MKIVKALNRLSYKEIAWLVQPREDKVLGRSDSNLLILKGCLQGNWRDTFYKDLRWQDKE